MRGEFHKVVTREGAEVGEEVVEVGRHADGQLYIVGDDAAGQTNVINVPTWAERRVALALMEGAF